MTTEEHLRKLALERFPRVSDRGLVRQTIRRLWPEDIEWEVFLKILRRWWENGWLRGNNLLRGKLTDAGVAALSKEPVPEPKNEACPRCGMPRHCGNCKKKVREQYQRELTNA